MSIEQNNNQAPARPETAPAQQRPLQWAEVQELARNRRDEAVSPNHPFFSSFSEEKRQRIEKDVLAKRAINTQRDRESKLQGRERVLADASEYILVERINESGWFGDAKAIGTSENDDFKHSVDGYLEKDGVTLGFDLTYSTDLLSLTTKISRIKNLQLDRGEPAWLDHYLPLDKEKLLGAGTSDGYPVGLPTVILGLPRDQMLNTIRNYQQNKAGRPDRHIGLIFLYQARLQLAHFHRYCMVTGKKNPLAWNQLKMYERALTVVNALWEEKKREMNLDEGKLLSFVADNGSTKMISGLLNSLMPEGKMPADKA